MPSNDGNIIIGIGADTKDFDDGIQKAHSGVGGFLGGIGKLAGGAGVLGLGIGAVVPIVANLAGGLVDAAKAADEEQVGMNRLYQTMKSNVAGWDGNTDAVEAYIAKQQELAFGDDQLRDSLNLLIGQTHDLKEAQALQSTAMDLARAKNISLEAATKLVGKTDMENFAILKRLGIQVTDNMTKEEALAAIRQQTAGQAEAYANTTEGAMTRLQTNMGNVVESIGHTILPKITEALGGVADFVASDAFQGMINTALAFVTTAFDNLGKIIDFLTPILSPLVGIFQNFAAALQAGQDPIQAVMDLLGNLGNYLTDLGGKVLDAIGNALPGITAKLGEWGAAFLDWIVKDVLPFIGARLADLGNAIWNWITGGGLSALISNLVTWGGAFLNFIQKDVLPFIVARLLDLGRAIWNWITGGGLASLVRNLVQWGGAFLGFLAKDVLPFIVTKLLELGNAIWNWITGGGLTALINNLVQWGGAFLGFVEKDVLPKIGAELKKIIDKIVDWVKTTAKDIGDKVKEIGSGIIDGIRNGINNAWQGLVNFLSTKVKDALPQFLKDWLGIHSPSTVTTQMGVYLAQGLGKGFQDGEGAMLTDFRGVLGSMAAEILLAMDKTDESSIRGGWNAGFDGMYDHLANAWGPQTDLQIKMWLTRWRGFVQDFAEDVASMMAGVTSSVPSGGGGGGMGGGTGSAQTVTGGPWGQRGGWGGGGGGNPIIVEVAFGAERASQVLATRQRLSTPRGMRYAR